MGLNLGDVRNRELRRNGEKEALLKEVTSGGDEVVSRCLLVDGYVGVWSGGEASWFDSISSPTLVFVCGRWLYNWEKDMATTFAKVKGCREKENQTQGCLNSWCCSQAWEGAAHKSHPNAVPQAKQST